MYLGHKKSPLLAPEDQGFPNTGICLSRPFSQVFPSRVFLEEPRLAGTLHQVVCRHAQLSSVCSMITRWPWYEGFRLQGSCTYLKQYMCNTSHTGYTLLLPEPEGGRTEEWVVLPFDTKVGELRWGEGGWHENGVPVTEDAFTCPAMI